MKSKKSLFLPGVVALLALTSAISGRAAETFENPVPVVKVAPTIPWAVAREGISGVVTVTFMVDENGTVRDPVVTNASDAELKHAVVRAISQWKFKPAYRNGAAIPMWVSVPVKFMMR